MVKLIAVLALFSTLIQVHCRSRPPTGLAPEEPQVTYDEDQSYKPRTIATKLLLLKFKALAPIALGLLGPGADEFSVQDALLSPNIEVIDNAHSLHQDGFEGAVIAIPTDGSNFNDISKLIRVLTESRKRSLQSNKRSLLTSEEQYDSSDDLDGPYVLYPNKRWYGAAVTRRNLSRHYDYA